MLSHAIDGKKVRALREAANLSVQQLAEAAGLSRWFLYKIEQGKAQPGRELAGRIALALGVTFKDIIAVPAPEQAPAQVAR